MADLEQRVTQLEREVRSIPDTLDLQERANESRFSALFAELDTIKRDMGTIKHEVGACLASSPRC